MFPKAKSISYNGSVRGSDLPHGQCKQWVRYITFYMEYEIKYIQFIFISILFLCHDMWHLTSFGFFQKCQFPLFFTPSPQVVASSLPRPTSYCSGLTAVGNPARGCQRSEVFTILYSERAPTPSPWWKCLIATSLVGAFFEFYKHIREISLTGPSPSHHCCWTLNSPRTRHISRELGCTGTYA